MKGQHMVTFTEQEKAMILNTLFETESTTNSTVRTLQNKYISLRNGGFFRTASRLNALISKIKAEMVQDATG
jgi:hypothetical protein